MSDQNDAPREHGPAFWIAFVVGSGIMAFGVRGILTNAAASDPATVFGWIVGGDLLHDFFLVPLVLIAGAVLARIVPEPWRTPVRAGLISSALVVAIAWPALRGYGRARVPDNTSVQPLDYVDRGPHGVGRRVAGRRVLVLRAVRPSGRATVSGSPAHRDA